MKTKMPYDFMYPIAAETIAKLRPHCKRIAPAGSLRRKRPEIGDIEIVAEPLEYLPDLFGKPTISHSIDQFNWSTLGELTLNGHKQKRVILPNEIQIDIFIVTPPAQWGVILLLRTGSADFNKKFVTEKKFGGLKPAHLKLNDGAVWKHNELMPTPQELDVFKLWDLKFIPPWERT